ncbi:Uncharacterised protein [Vibrio cholerae]|uniref:Uncharacterized protein n=1 Tax=Vibrio cholerae TaxID=666 RepID=A0A656A8J2_VIBCL|nr:Uncharacterised protein [Vibrio cholerae]CSC96573.1 Uncharacterised protein [Vibrio cholerae]CSD05127.1 Uncharacterised protein [Vibrio cholerae]
MLIQYAAFLADVLGEFRDWLIKALFQLRHLRGEASVRVV